MRRGAKYEKLGEQQRRKGNLKTAKKNQMGRFAKKRVNLKVAEGAKKIHRPLAKHHIRPFCGKPCKPQRPEGRKENPYWIGEFMRRDSKYDEECRQFYI